MISSELEVVFVHIPKVAGQSVESCFLQHHGLSHDNRQALLLGKNTEPEKGPPRLAHLTAGEYVELDYLSQNDFDRYFKFSFVRNPWARLVSEYKWRGYHKKWGFKDWLQSHFPQPGWTSQWRHVMPQYDYLFDKNGKCLVDFVGRLENIGEDFELVRQEIPVLLPPLPHINKSSAEIKGFSDIDLYKMSRSIWNRLSSKQKMYASYMEYYDDWSWNWVADRYRKDIESFGYTGVTRKGVR